MSFRACLMLVLAVTFGVAVGCSGPDAPKRPKGGKTTFVPHVVSHLV